MKALPIKIEHGGGSVIEHFDNGSACFHSIFVNGLGILEDSTRKYLHNELCELILDYRVTEDLYRWLLDWNNFFRLNPDELNKKITSPRIIFQNELKRLRKEIDESTYLSY
ncbi:MAG: hypothetical protein OXB93_02090, partial [Cytophagales bacterium]|nr:hypothetical protein [Cytophagales bacterium]